MNDDGQLLKRFANTRDEEAFAELTRRYVHLVYSAALRQTGGRAPLAEDITQAVFIELARHAGRLRRHPALVGWLHTTTFRLASHAARTETRRREREQKARDMEPAADTPEPATDWPRVWPILDGALQELRAEERLAILSRFFENRSLREVGACLGVDEKAAAMRVQRALEKLRRVLRRRGVVSTEATLAALLVAHTVSAAPAHLAVQVATVAVTAGAASTAGFGLFHFMATTSLKITGAAAIAAVIFTPVIMQRQTIHALEAEVVQLRQGAARSAAPRASGVAEGSGADEAAELARLRAEHLELLRLRGEIGVLRREAATRAQIAGKPGQPSGMPGSDTMPAPGAFLPSDSWTDAGFATDEAALQTRGWALRANDLKKFEQAVALSDGVRKKMEEALPPEVRVGRSLEQAVMMPMTAKLQKDAPDGYRILARETLAANESWLEVETRYHSGRIEKEKLRFVQNGGEWKQLVDEEFLGLPAPKAGP